MTEGQVEAIGAAFIHSTNQPSVLPDNWTYHCRQCTELCRSVWDLNFTDTHNWMRKRHPLHILMQIPCKNWWQKLFLSRVFFSDATTSHLSRDVKWHNLRLWASENPYAVVSHMRDSFKLNIFCAVLKNKVFGPVFFAKSTLEWNSLPRCDGTVPYAYFTRRGSQWYAVSYFPFLWRWWILNFLNNREFFEHFYISWLLKEFFVSWGLLFPYEILISV